MKQIDLSGLIKGLMVVIAIGLAFGKHSGKGATFEPSAFPS